LAQLGRLSDVELELKALHAQLQPSEDRTFLALAIELGAPGAQLYAAEHGGPDVAAGYCPVSEFAPADGFRLDRAVIYAVVRQESRFVPVAVSHSNARGLMQLLPSTAADLAKSRVDLHDPATNMQLGQ
jgi:soluble lytic murein transglycosylase-like protein